jgi:hypothetical protein
VNDELVLQVGGKPTVDAGVYPAVMVELGTFKVEAEDGERQLLRWTFAIDGDDQGTVEGVSSMALGPKSKAYRWLTALIGPDAMASAPALTPRDLVGRECLVQVVLNDAGYPKVGDLMARPKAKKAA